MPLPLHARLFVAAIIAAGTLILGSSLRELLAAGVPATWCLLAALGGVTGSCMIKLPRIETRFSLSDALVFSTALLVGPTCAALVASVDALAASVRFNKADTLYLSRLLFNAAAAAVSIWVPGQAFLALGGQPAAASTMAPHAFAVPVLVLVAGYSVLNTGAVATVLALASRVPPLAVWRENFAWVWIPHAWSGLVAIGLAMYVPNVNAFSLLVILIVGAVGYATVRLYLGKVEESTDRLHKLNDLYLATIRALAMAIDAKDQVTHGHIQRVQVYAVGLARALGVTDELTIKGIEAGALLHDTGKIAVPEHILNKPGKLTPQEYERMKAHVTIGADILSGIDFPYPVIPLVRHHHENWDGTGYPDGLHGEAIPIGARILSVVDCFDALTSDRPYRRALTTEAAIAILRERSGTMYDPRIVDAFIQVHPELSSALADEEEPRAEGQGPRATALPAPPDAPERGQPAHGLSDLPRLAALGLPREEVGLLLLHRLQSRLRFSTALVYAPRPAADRLETVCAVGPHAGIFGCSTIGLGEGLSGWVAAHRQMVVNGNPALDLLGPVSAVSVPLSSALVLPFTDPAGGSGALAFYAEAAEAFTLDDARLAGEAAAYLARAFCPAGGLPGAAKRSRAA